MLEMAFNNDFIYFNLAKDNDVSFPELQVSLCSSYPFEPFPSLLFLPLPANPSSTPPTSSHRP